VPESWLGHDGSLLLQNCWLVWSIYAFEAEENLTSERKRSFPIAI